VKGEPTDRSEGRSLLLRKTYQDRKEVTARKGEENGTRFPGRREERGKGYSLRDEQKGQTGACLQA